MKTKFCITTLLFAGIATTTWSLSPVLRAQMSTADQTQSTKANDSTADKNSATTGNPSDQPGTLDRASSKDTTNSLDKNPSTQPTDSADKAATKDPTGQPQDQEKSMSSTQKLHRTSDREFLVKAAQGGMTEVELGKLAQEKGASADVKQFGSRMVADHSKADAELKTVADKNGVTVPTALDAKHQAMVDHFSKLNGPDFDKAYVHAMVKDHENDVAEFREETSDAQNPDVKNFADSTLKVIESHLTEIKSIQGKLK